MNELSTVILKSLNFLISIKYGLVGREISNQLTLGAFEIESLFSSFMDEKSNKVSNEIFSRLLSELEKVINFFLIDKTLKLIYIEKSQYFLSISL